MPIRFGSAEARQILDCDKARGDWMRDVAGYGYPAPMPERDCHGDCIVRDEDDDDDFVFVDEWPVTPVSGGENRKAVQHGGD